jgi:hypothetical protein
MPQIYSGSPPYFPPYTLRHRSGYALQNPASPQNSHRFVSVTINANRLSIKLPPYPFNGSVNFADEKPDKNEAQIHGKTRKRDGVHRRGKAALKILVRKISDRTITERKAKRIPEPPARREMRCRQLIYN